MNTNESSFTEFLHWKSLRAILIKCLKWHNRIPSLSTYTFYEREIKLTNFSIKGRWPASCHVLGAEWVFGAVQQKLFRGHYYGIFVVWQGCVVAAITLRRRGGPWRESIRGTPLPARPLPAIHLRYAHKANRTRNGRPTFPLLLNLFISLLILDLNFNVCEIRLWIIRNTDKFIECLFTYHR